MGEIQAAPVQETAPMPQKPKKGRAIAMVIVAVIAVAGVAAGVILNRPKVRLLRGMTDLAAQIQAYRNPAMEQIDLATLRDNMQKEAYTTTAGLTVTLPGNEEVSTLNIDMNMGRDNENRKANIDLELGAYYLNLAQGSIIVDDNTMYISLPKLLSDTYSIRLDTLGADYRSSIWKQELGLDIDEDAAYDFFAQSKADYTSIYGLIEAMEPQAQTLKDSVLIEKATDKASVRGNSKSLLCSGVSVTIPQNDVNAFLTAFQENFKASSLYQQQVAQLIEKYGVAYLTEDKLRTDIESKVDAILGIRCMNDVSVNLYMDSRGRIVRIATPQPIAFKDSEIRSIELSANFLGTERTLDMVDAEYKLETADGTQTYTLDREASITQTQYTDHFVWEKIGADNQSAYMLGYDNTWNLDTLKFDKELVLEVDADTFKYSADGVYKDITKGEAYTLDIHTASLYCNDEALIRAAGDIGVAPGMETADTPQSVVDLMSIDSEKLYNMLYEVLTALKAYM